MVIAIKNSMFLGVPAFSVRKLFEFQGLAIVVSWMSPWGEMQATCFHNFFDTVQDEITALSGIARVMKPFPEALTFFGGDFNSLLPGESTLGIENGALTLRPDQAFRRFERHFSSLTELHQEEYTRKQVFVFY